MEVVQQSQNRFNKLLGICIEREDDQGCVASLVIHSDLWNSMEGIVHGGVTSTLADVAMGHGAAPHVNGVQQCVTVESKINYLAPAKGSHLKAEANVLKKGKKIIVMEAKVFDEKGSLVAISTGTYARIRR